MTQIAIHFHKRHCTAAVGSCPGVAGNSGGVGTRPRWEKALGLCKRCCWPGQGSAGRGVVGLETCFEGEPRWFAEGMGGQ